MMDTHLLWLRPKLHAIAYSHSQSTSATLQFCFEPLSDPSIKPIRRQHSSRADVLKTLAACQSCLFLFWQRQITTEIFLASCVRQIRLSSRRDFLLLTGKKPCYIRVADRSSIWYLQCDRALGSRVTLLSRKLEAKGRFSYRETSLNTSAYKTLLAFMFCFV